MKTYGICYLALSFVIYVSKYHHYQGMRLLRARSERGAGINANDTSRSTGHNQVRSSSRTRA
jgi:hypothetical protein